MPLALDNRVAFLYDLVMASLTKKMVRGRPYYYVRECKRIAGKPTIVWQKYLGRLEDIVAAVEQTRRGSAVIPQRARASQVP